MEMPVIISYRPNVKALKESKVHILVAAGEETAMYLFCASRWLATQLRTDLHMLPGGHVGYADQPKEFATALLPLLEKCRGEFFGLVSITDVPARKHVQIGSQLGREPSGGAKQVHGRLFTCRHKNVYLGLLKRFYVGPIGD